MSVKVELSKLADTMAGYTLAYLLTVSDDQRPHAVAVQPVFGDRCLTVAAVGRRTAANLAARPEVTLLFPPREPGGYSLIVDGEASTGDGVTRIVPAHAVLHRPADHPAEPVDGSCGNDCVPVYDA